MTLGATAPDHVTLAINAANAVLVPSEAEGFGLAVLEALACDVPVLATPVGVHPQALAGIEGTLCAPYDRGLWSAALAPLLAQADPRIAGRERAAEYSSERMAERVAAAWRSLLADTLDVAAGRAGRSGRRRGVGRSHGSGRTFPGGPLASRHRGGDRIGAGRRGGGVGNGGAWSRRRRRRRGGTRDGAGEGAAPDDGMVVEAEPVELATGAGESAAPNDGVVVEAESVELATGDGAAPNDGVAVERRPGVSGRRRRGAGRRRSRRPASCSGRWFAGACHSCGAGASSRCTISAASRSSPPARTAA